MTRWQKRVLLGESDHAGSWCGTIPVSRVLSIAVCCIKVRVCRPTAIIRRYLYTHVVLSPKYDLSHVYRHIPSSSAVHRKPATVRMQPSLSSSLNTVSFLHYKVKYGRQPLLSNLVLSTEETQNIQQIRICLFISTEKMGGMLSEFSLAVES